MSDRDDTVTDHWVDKVAAMDRLVDVVKGLDWSSPVLCGLMWVNEAWVFSVDGTSIDGQRVSFTVEHDAPWHAVLEAVKERHDHE